MKCSFSHLITFIYFRLQNYTFFSIIYYLLFFMDKWRKISQNGSFMCLLLLFLYAICLFLLNPYSEWMQYSSCF